LSTNQPLLATPAETSVTYEECYDCRPARRLTTMRYDIRLKGHLAPRWAAWFGDLSLTRERDGTTLLTGPVADQAALHSLLHKVRDLGLPLLSVTCIDPGQPDAPSCASR
jgi:hypothetical protein